MAVGEGIHTFKDEKQLLVLKLSFSNHKQIH